jgi:dihydrofolate reductase
MARIVVTEFVALDGIGEEPGQWSLDYWNDDIAKFKEAELAASDALLLGRKTYEGFAAAWPQRGGDPFADKFNSMPKYVATTTLDRFDWQNSRRLGADVPGEVARLKRQAGQDIVIHGSMTLVNSLLPHGLIDEFRLLVYPLLLGTGRRVFQDGSAAKLRLAESRDMGSGVVLLRYQPA